MTEINKRFIAEDKASVKAYQHVVNMIEENKFDTKSIKNVSLDMIDYFKTSIKRYESYQETSDTNKNK